MNESDKNIELINNYIENCNIHISVPNEYKGVVLHYSIELFISDIIMKNEVANAQVKLSHTVVAQKEEKDLYSINVTIVGEFEIHNTKNDKERDEILKNSGIPVLFQMLRSYIISTLALSGVKNIDFPIIDHKKFFKEASIEKSST